MNLHIGNNPMDSSNLHRLGTQASSQRYKENIQDMGAASDVIHQLQPVTFTYKHDPSGIKQYGLIAEEVEQVAPDLAVFSSTGEVDTVNYQAVNAMLLNEFQQQHAVFLEQEKAMAMQERELAANREELESLKLQLLALMSGN